MSFKFLPMRLLELIGQLFPENAVGCKIRGAFYKPFLKECGKNFQVALGAKLEHTNNISVGNDVYIGHGSWISGLRGGIRLDDEVMIGPGVKMVSNNHTFVNGSARFGPGIGKPIHIGKGAWIASNVVVTAGVKVGASCLLAASTVVTKDTQERAIVAGIPGKIIGNISENHKDD